MGSLNQESRGLLDNGREDHPNIMETHQRVGHDKSVQGALYRIPGALEPAFGGLPPQESHNALYQPESCQEQLLAPRQRKVISSKVSTKLKIKRGPFCEVGCDIDLKDW